MAHSPLLPTGPIHLALPFGSARDAIVLSALRDVMGRRPGVRLGRVLIYCAASEERARAVQESVCAELGVQPEGLWGTIEGVLGRLSREEGGELERLGSHQSELLLRDVLSDVLGRQPARGTLAQVSAALARIRRALAPADRLETLDAMIARSETGLAKRLSTLRETLAGYDQRLAALGRVDFHDLPWRIAERAQSVFGALPMLIVDDLYRFNPAWQHLLQAACEHAEHSLILTRASNSASETPAHEVASANFRAFADRYDAAPDSLRELAVDDESAVAKRALLDASSAAPLSQEHALACGLQVNAERSALAETRAAIARIKHLVRDQGVALSNIRVCFTTNEQEAFALPHFDLAGIPYRSETPVPLTRAPSVSAVLELYRVASLGFEREGFIAALRSPWLAGLLSVAYRNDQNKPALDWSVLIGHLAEVARAVRIIGGTPGQRLRDVWLKALKDFPSELDKPDASPRLRPFRALKESVIPALIQLVESLDDLLYARSTEELLDAIDRFSERCNLRAEIASGIDSDDATLSAIAAWNQRAWQRFERLTTDLREGLVLSPTATDASFPACTAELIEEVSALTIERLRKGEGVRMGGLLDARGRQVDHLILCGLLDGEFPFPDPENAYLSPRLLNRSHAQGISDLAWETLNGDVDPLAGFRHLLACGLMQARESIHLNFPALKEDAEQAPCLPLIELCERIEGASEWLKAKESEASSDVELLSQPELQLELARRVHSQASSADPSAQLDTLPLAKSKSVDEHQAWLPTALSALSINLERDDLRVIESPYTGWVDTESAELNAQAMKRFDNQTPKFSPSALEAYAQCPQKFWFRYTLGVGEPDRPALDIGASERGTFVHLVLEQFLLAMREVLASDPQSIKLASWADAPDGDKREQPLISFERYEALADHSARELLLQTFKRLRAEQPVPAASFQRWCRRVEASLASEKPAIFSDLSEFLKWERANQQAGLFPWLMEFEFGFSKDEPDYTLRDDAENPRLQLRGSIDRVDVLVSKGEARAMLIRDYKTGSSKLASRVSSGTALQLPIYSLAVHHHTEGVEAAGFFYHKVRDERGFVLEAPHLGEGVVQALIQSEAVKPKWQGNSDPSELLEEITPLRLHQILDAMEAGRFHHTLVDGTASCNYCKYRHACAVRDEKQFAHGQIAPTLREEFGVYAPDPA